MLPSDSDRPDSQMLQAIDFEQQPAAEVAEHNEGEGREAERMPQVDGASEFNTQMTEPSSVRAAFKHSQSSSARDPASSEERLVGRLFQEDSLPDRAVNSVGLDTPGHVQLDTPPADHPPNVNAQLDGQECINGAECLLSDRLPQLDGAGDDEAGDSDSKQAARAAEGASASPKPRENASPGMAMGQSGAHSQGTRRSRRQVAVSQRRTTSAARSRSHSKSGFQALAVQSSQHSQEEREFGKPQPAHPAGPTRLSRP